MSTTDIEQLGNGWRLVTDTYWVDPSYGMGGGDWDYELSLQRWVPRVVKKHRILKDKVIIGHWTKVARWHWGGPSPRGAYLRERATARKDLLERKKLILRDEAASR